MGKYFVIGLGSMGKRRVRCLLELGVKPGDIWGMDTRADRCRQAQGKYGIRIAGSMDGIDFSDVKAVIVSLPPDRHKLGVDVAVKYKKPVFVEAGVLLSEAEAIKAAADGIFVAPSCTFVFQPMIKEIKKIVQSGELGKVCNFSYHSGQYLPDWHPWEDVNDFYVSSRATGGAREIVPYELTWIVDVFGFPNEIKGYFRMTGDIGCRIEDSYAGTLSYDGMAGTLLVDVVSRYPVRNLVVNFQNGQIQWKWDNEKLDVYYAKSGVHKEICQDRLKHEEGYSAMVNEDMYMDELKAFLNGIKNPAAYPNTLDKDISVLKLLNALEDSDGGFARSL